MKTLTVRLAVDDEQASEAIWDSVKTKSLVAGCRITAIAIGNLFAERDTYKERWDAAEELLSDEGYHDDLDKIEEEYPLDEDR